VLPSRRWPRLVLAAAAAVTASLLPASAATADPAQPPYPYTTGYHFTGTPLALGTFDAGAAGQVVVMLEYNRKGVVPNSYVAVITSGFDIVARANDARMLQPVQVFQRPGESAPAPDLGRLTFTIKNELAPVQRKAELADPAIATNFIFFHNDATGENKLVSNPLLPNTTSLIPGTTALQLSTPLFEIFPVDANGQTSVGTKQVLKQPALTPNIDAAERELRAALASERRASAALDLTKHLGGKGYIPALKAAVQALDAAHDDVGRAVAAGELWTDASAIRSRIDEAAKLDRYSGSGLALAAPDKAGAQQDLRHQLAVAGSKKLAAITLLDKARAARRAGR